MDNLLDTPEWQGAFVLGCYLDATYLSARDAGELRDVLRLAVEHRDGSRVAEALDLAEALCASIASGRNEMKEWAEEKGMRPQGRTGWIAREEREAQALGLGDTEEAGG